MQAWVAFETNTFGAMYLQDVEMVFNRPHLNNEGGVRKQKLFVFAQIALPFGELVQGDSFIEGDMQVAQWFVLNNCDKIIEYLDEQEKLMKREHLSHLCREAHRDLFPCWFHEQTSKRRTVLRVSCEWHKILGS